MKIEVHSAQFDEAYALVQQWQRRVRAVRRQFLYYAVQKTYDDLLGYLPSDRKELRASLRMQKIRGLPDSVDGYVIHSAPKGRAIAQAESENAVVYVAAKSNLMRSVPKETSLLEAYSPWTVDTLPYPPDQKTANVISRRVSKREVNRVRQMRLRDRPKWRREMIKDGIRVYQRGLEPKARETLTVPDTAFESLRLEFGLGGEPSKPHWRKAILKLALRGGAGMIARKREFTKAMTSLSFTAWERWPRKTVGFVTVAGAKRFVPFQQRLGLRVGRR